MLKIKNVHGIEDRKVVSQKEWLAARIELLKAEKEHTRRSDELARQRQQLPWVRIDKKYQFESEEGKTSLADLFKGRSQLLVYHFMFGPDYTSGCPTCSTIADGFNGFAAHLANHDVMLWCISRAPFAKIQAFKRRMGWMFPWASSFGGDFNVGFRRLVHRGATTRRRHRIQLPARAADVRDTVQNGQGSRRRITSRPGRHHDRHRRAHLLARATGHERFCARRRCRLSHLFHLCARP